MIPGFIPGPLLAAAIAAGAGNDAFTTLLLHMDGTNGSTTFTDSSQTNATVTANGNATISTAASKFGGGSGNLDVANSSYLTIADNAALRMGNGDFTIDWWMLVNNFNGAGFGNPIWWKGNGAEIFLRMSSSGDAVATFNNTGSALSVASAFLADASWHHYAFVRHGTGTAFYRDGVSKGTGTDSPVSNMTGTGIIAIGASNSPAANFLDGRIDEFRVSKGIARWTAGFTPQASAYS